MMKGGNGVKKVRIAFFAFLFLLPFTSLLHVSAESMIGSVYHVPIKETVEKGLYQFLERAISEAEENGAEVIIFEIDTPGGEVQSAGEIGNLLARTDIKTVAFINNEALSAGAFISLHMDEIYMVPNSTIGSAAIITQDGNAADKKAQSYWLKAMESAAISSNRDPIYAKAMADESIDLPELGAEKGKLLTLTANDAIKVGYAEGIVQNLDELLIKLGYSKEDVVKVEETLAEKIARFITNPIVVPILLSIGSLGLILELYSPGFGIPGFMGIFSLLLFFYGHFIAGLAGWESIILFVIGIILIGAEFVLPGGIAGLLGLGSIFLSIVLAGDSVVQMMIYLFVAITVAIIAMIIMMKVFKKKLTIFNKIVLKDSTSTEKGYISNKSRLDLIGLTGIAMTDLRPSGTIIINDERIDAVSEGEFIPGGSEIKVIKAEGSRIVVRKVQK
jgi:membrane-bound serine protease (ClpP class)